MVKHRITKRRVWTTVPNTRERPNLSRAAGWFDSMEENVGLSKYNFREVKGWWN